MAGLSDIYDKYFNPSTIMGGSSSYDVPDISGDVSRTIKPFFDPYTQAGTDSLGSLQEQLARMYQDPNQLTADLGQGFRASPGYEYSVNQATDAANRAAAAGGGLGSGAEQVALAGQVQGMADQDYQDYMNQQLGIYGQGVQGLSNLTGLGYQAASTEAEDLARAQMAGAGLDVGMQKAGMQQGSDMFRNIASLAPLFM